MTNSPARDAPSDRPPWDVPKVRQCLRCKASFQASGPASGFVLAAKVRPHGELVRRLGPVLPATADNVYPAGSAFALTGRKEIACIPV